MKLSACKDGAVGRIHATPGLAILILLMTHPHAEFQVREGAANEVDQRTGIGAPVRLECRSSFQQVARQI